MSDMKVRRTASQEDCDRLVRREVYYCVSSLVWAFSPGDGVGSRGEPLSELVEQAAELFAPLIDHEEAARDHIRNGMDPSDLAEYCEANDITACAVTDNASPEALKKFANAMREAIIEALESGEGSGWEFFCIEQGVEPYESEIFEHWIISDWLADRLKERGERVDRDFAGLTVWARTTTGQAIALDSVIVEITTAALNA